MAPRLKTTAGGAKKRAEERERRCGRELATTLFSAREGAVLAYYLFSACQAAHFDSVELTQRIIP